MITLSLLIKKKKLISFSYSFVGDCNYLIYNSYICLINCTSNNVQFVLLARLFPTGFIVFKLHVRTVYAKRTIPENIYICVDYVLRKPINYPSVYTRVKEELTSKFPFELGKQNTI